MKYNKKDLDNFDYNKRYKIASEHIWDFISNDEKSKKYKENREKIFNPIINNVQSDEEKTGQIGTMF